MKARRWTKDRKVALTIRQCVGKRKFLSEEEASAPQLRAYRCDLCKFWHQTKRLQQT